MKKTIVHSHLTARVVALLLMMACLLPLLPEAHAASVPAVSTSKYYQCYTIASSGRVYAYTSSALTTKTGGYIDASSDECRIVKISGNAVQASYPISGGRRTAWFPQSAFTAFSLTSSNYTSITAASKITTYRRSTGGTTYGYVAKGDRITILGTSGARTQIIYPAGNQYKLAWVETSALSGVSGTGSTAYVKLSNPSNRLNVRSSPSISAPIIQKLSHGTAVQLISSSNGWSKILVNGVTGYVSSQYLSTAASSGTSTSARQAAMVAQAENLLGSSAYSGYCQRFVRVVGERIGLPAGNAASALAACQMWRVSTSMDNIPIGAAVYLRSKNTSSAGYTYGHVGIYVGNGYVIHAVSTVKKQSLSSLLQNYTYLGWGWQAGVDLR